MHLFQKKTVFRRSFFEEGQALPNPSDAKQTAEYVGETRVSFGGTLRERWVTLMFRIQCNLKHETSVILTNKNLWNLKNLMVWKECGCLLLSEKSAHF